jgi:SAM-dependent methyltransferase
MAHRQDKNLVLGDSVKLAKRKINNRLYRGFELKASAQPSIMVKNVFRWYPFCEQTEVTGWAVQAFDNEHDKSQLDVCLHSDSGDVVLSRQIAIGSQITPIFLPERFAAKASNQNYHLTLKLEGARKKWFAWDSKPTQQARAFIAVHEVLHREEILQLCQGKGVEIGPGPRPQVYPSAQVDVTYIEQSSPKDWERLYNDAGKQPVNSKLWSKYQIGNACDLPAEDQSLDFIFSSHVFEHLANPLGHLAYWISKLNDGGKVLGVVPDVAGCKDYVHRPSPMNEILAEQASGDMEPTLEHYARWAKYCRPGQDPEEFYNAKRSIHVHYYTNRNMSEVLQYAVDHLGYAWFDIRHVPNHKDFYFVLSR